MATRGKCATFAYNTFLCYSFLLLWLKQILTVMFRIRDAVDMLLLHVYSGCHHLVHHNKIGPHTSMFILHLTLSFTHAVDIGYPYRKGRPAFNLSLACFPVEKNRFIFSLLIACKKAEICKLGMLILTCKSRKQACKISLLFLTCNSSLPF